MNIKYSENSINYQVHNRFCEMSCTQYDTNHITWEKAWGKSSFGGYKGKLTGLNYIKQLINSEDMTSQIDNQIGNLCSDFHCFTHFFKNS